MLLTVGLILAFLQILTAQENGGKANQTIAEGSYAHFNSSDLEAVKDFNYTEVALESDNRFTPFTLRDQQFSIATFARVNWFTAQQICSFHGMTLASLTSTSENKNLQQLLQRSGFRFLENFWLSGTDLAARGDWYWFSRGQPFTYDNWNPSEPAHINGLERCLTMYTNGKWNAWPCDAAAFFVCENRCSSNEQGQYGSPGQRPQDSYDVTIYPPYP